MGSGDNLIQRCVRVEQGDRLPNLSVELHQATSNVDGEGRRVGVGVECPTGQAHTVRRLVIEQPRHGPDLVSAVLCSDPRGAVAQTAHCLHARMGGIVAKWHTLPITLSAYPEAVSRSHEEFAATRFSDTYGTRSRLWNATPLLPIELL